MAYGIYTKTMEAGRNIYQNKVGEGKAGRRKFMNNEMFPSLIIPIQSKNPFSICFGPL